MAALAKSTLSPSLAPTIDPATLPTVAPETTGTLLPLPLKLDGAQVAHIAISPDYANDHTILVAANDQRLHRSSDAGASWSSQLLGQIVDLEFSPSYATDHRIFAGLIDKQAPDNQSAIQVQLSADRGQSWQALHSPGSVPLQGGMRLFISPAYDRDHTLFATLFGWSGAIDDPVVGHLYRSIDNGASWALIDTPCQAHHLAISPAYARDQILYMGCYATGRSSSNGLGLHRSSDNGASWQRLTWDAVTSLALAPTTPQPTLFMHAARSTDSGATWTAPQQNIGQTLSVLTSPDFANDHTLLALTWRASQTSSDSTTLSLLRSVDGGDTWASVIADLKTSVDAPGAALALGRDGTNKLLVLIGLDGALWRVNGRT